MPPPLAAVGRLFLPLLGRQRAGIRELSPERFRKAQERVIIAQVAEMILQLSADQAAIPGTPDHYSLEERVDLYWLAGTECRIGVVHGSIRRVRFAPPPAGSPRRTT